MNCTSRKIIFSFLPTGALLSSKSQHPVRWNAPQILIHRQILTARQPPIKSPETPPTFGQPTHFTHPHRIRKGEVVPGITVEELKLRREKLLESIKSYCCNRDLGIKNFLIVIPSACKKYMTEKIPYVFRQNSDFLYLTGCLEQDSLLVMTVQDSKHESVIFMRGRDPNSELWDGPRTGLHNRVRCRITGDLLMAVGHVDKNLINPLMRGIDQAVELFGVDKSIQMREFSVFIESFMKDNKDCMLWYDFLNEVHPVVHKIMQQYLVGTWNKIWESPKRFIHQLRLFKSPAEQLLMKKSCEIASLAIKNTMKESRPLDNEAFIQARVDFHCRMNGAEYLAYPPVVASSERANIIHYIDNNQVVEDGDLVLMDAGCEYHGYCSDITRTWPISGKFSPAQRVLYEIVLSVQADVISMCSRFPALDELHVFMTKLLGVRLKDSGVLSSVADDVDKCAREFCPHHVSHYLGMDVHDTSTIFRHIPLEPGMVCTIEPGVYVSKNNKNAKPEYHGIGIRIEDDILITKNGPVVLTSSCPKHPDDIEKLRES